MRAIQLTNKRLVLLLAVFTLLGGCATKSPSFGDLVLKESGQIGAIGTKWEEGNALLSKGQKLLKKGESQIKTGRKNVTKGEKQMEEGQRLVDEATKEYKARQRELSQSS